MNGSGEGLAHGPSDNRTKRVQEIVRPDVSKREDPRFLPSKLNVAGSPRRRDAAGENCLKRSFGIACGIFTDDEPPRDVTRRSLKYFMAISLP